MATKVLLIDDDGNSRQTLRKKITHFGLSPIEEVDLLQKAIETVELQHSEFDLVVCNYRGPSKILLRLFLDLCGDIPTLFFFDDKSETFQKTLERNETLFAARLETIPSGDLSALDKVLERLRLDGFFSAKRRPDSDFVRVALRMLQVNRPLLIDIYFRIAPNRYLMRFKKGDSFDAMDLSSLSKDGSIDFFYVHKDDAETLTTEHGKVLDELIHAKNASPEVIREAAQDSLVVIQDIVHRLGFSPQVEELAKKTVTLSLKAFGSSPKLAELLNRFKKHEKKYIASHSLMLAEIACAIACKIGWNSASTYLKLTFAAFLHDLAMTNNTLARGRRIEDISSSKSFNAQDLQKFKSHPITASEWAQKIHQIPPDVDSILLQHHERPDGTGFPRALNAHKISPLAAIFILSHDLLDFFLDAKPEAIQNSDAETHLSAFLKANVLHYHTGAFRKICESIESGIPFMVQ